MCSVIWILGPIQCILQILMCGMIHCIPRRYITAVLGFLSFAVLNAQRVNITYALEVMTVSPFRTLPEHTDAGCGKISYAINATNTRVRHGTYDWDSKTQGYVLSSSFIGFVLTQIIGGRFAETLGAKQILCFSLLCASFCNIVSPFAAVWSVYLLIGAQFIKGMAQGFIQPAVSCLMARWYPKEEMSFLSSVTYSGFPAGALIGGIVSGALCDTEELGGWPSVFYVFGVAGVLLALVEIFLIHNSPEEYHSKNSYDLETTVNDKTFNSDEKKIKTPWIQMVLSVPTWALLAGMIGQYWVTFYFISVHPAYIADVLNLDISQNGLFSSLPYILQIFITWVGSSISDCLTQKKIASTDTVRKWCNTISCLGFSLSMIGVVFAGCSTYLNIISFFIAMSLIGLGYPGSLTVPMDMTKNFAGTLVGLSGTIASSTGFILPFIVGYIVQNEGNLTHWSYVIYISVSVVMTSGILFHLFGSAEQQNWDDSSAEDLKTQSKSKDQENKFKTISSIT